MADGLVVTGSAKAFDERVRAAYEMAADWLLSDVMSALVDLFTDRTDDVSDKWLHLNEELPDWLIDLVEGDATTGVALIDGEMRAALRRTLALERVASQHFNFRSRDGRTYRERSQAVAGDLSAEVRERALELATSLGLVVPSRPAHPSYDQTLVLGGGYRSPQLRAQYTREQIDAGTGVGDVYLLGSPRPLIDDPPEQPVVAAYAPSARDEFDLMVAAAEVELGAVSGPVEFLCGCESVARICPQWRFADDPGAAQTPPEFTHERVRRLAGPDSAWSGAALSAATGRPPYRPDTADTFGLWARYTAPADGCRLLAVTTQVFVPFQSFDALRRLTLPFGVQVDTIGFGAERGDRPLSAEYLLQEALSALRSARRLVVACAAELLGR